VLPARRCQVFETYWTTGRGNETMGSSYAMLDQTVYGHSVGRPGGRPISHWPRLAAGHSDDLG
jgi:hypothetical protein